MRAYDLYSEIFMTILERLSLSALDSRLFPNVPIMFEYFDFFLTQQLLGIRTGGKYLETRRDTSYFHA